MAEIENLKIGSGGTIHIVGNEDIVAEAWAVGQSYVKDKSYVINNHVLYVCNTSHTSTSPFDPTNWTQITVGKSLGDILSAIPASASDLPYAAGVSTADAIGVLSNLDTSTQTSLVVAINELIATSKLNPVYGNTASGAIATFDTSLALPLQDLQIAINAVQESGTPTPSSPKLISGFTGANIHVADDETPHIIDNITPITWQSEAGTVYGGSLDVTSGVLTVTHAITTLDGSQGSSSFRVSAKTGYTQTEWYDYRAIGIIGATIISDKFTSTGGEIPTVLYGVGGSPNGERCFFGLPDTVTTTAEANTWFENNPTVIVYPIATPTTYQLTPTQISAIVGTNNIFTDTNGDTSVMYACSLKDYIDGQ